MDYLYYDWYGKADAFVSDGTSLGVRQSRTCVGSPPNSKLAHARAQVSFSRFTDFENFAVFKPGHQYAGHNALMYDKLEP